MIDAAAILDQKRSPGLIENPLRDFLVAEAMRAPANQAVVELGAYMGRSTGHLALGVSRGHGASVISVDPWELAEPTPEDYRATAPSVASYTAVETREAYERHLIDVGVRDLVTTIQATAVDAAATYDGPPVALLFHDALHRAEDVFADLKAWLPHMAPVATVVLHDVGDPRYGVEAGAQKAFTRTKALRERWAWDGREIRLWAKNPTKRGFAVVRTR